MTSKKKLVIVESPAKSRTLKKFLGRDFEIAACNGHVRDLPPKSLGVKVDKDFQPTYKIIKGKEKIIDDLKKLAKKAQIVFLAPDPDREGEAIAWHLKYLLDQDKKIKRIEFHEITKEAVANAVKHPREIDEHRVNAQQTRRILDRLVGFKISPLLWKKVRKGLSAGRVQSVAVRLICEREELIKAFKAEEYWDIQAALKTAKNEEFTARLVARNNDPIGVSPKDKGEVIRSEARARQIAAELEEADYQVSEVTIKEQQRYPSPPFITSTLQQEAARKLGYTAKRTMMVAQSLYENGHITYMRTDSVRIAEEALKSSRSYIKTAFGQEFLPESPNHYKTKKQAQDAHEAIRPTHPADSPESLKAELKAEEYKLYDLIWKRFLACQMKPAVFDQTSVDITAGIYQLRASGSTIKFEGFIKVYLESRDEDDESEAEKLGDIPVLDKGDALNMTSVKPEQHFTQPPPRYNEASLVKELEKKGIGRPSTYAPIISTIQARGYVEKEGKALKPTEIGQVTNGLLVKHFPKILDYEFTAFLEDELDEIVEGKLAWVKALHDFYGPFEKSLAGAEKNMEKVKKEIQLEEKCPECGKPLIIRQGRFGDFIACSSYPECKYTRDIKTPEQEQAAAEHAQACEKCGKPMILKHSRFGSFMACSGYPACKNIKPILRKVDVKCPLCGQELVERRTKSRKIFFGCAGYPKCRFASWQRPTKENIQQLKDEFEEKEAGDA